MRKIFYFTAVWCGPCKLYGPVLDRVQREFLTELDIQKIDIDDQKESASKFNVSSIPTIIEVDQDGEEVKRLVGAYPFNKVKEELGL